MADKKKDVLSESDTQRNAWKKAEKLINQNKPEDALLILREFDESGSHQTTLRLAGKATHKIAQQTNSKSDYRKAASLLRDSVNMNPKERNRVEHTMICSMKCKRRGLGGVRLEKSVMQSQQ